MPTAPLKMSTVFEQFAEPFKQRLGSNIEGYRQVLTTALVAWNAALRQDSERVAFIRAMIGAGQLRAPAHFRRISGELIGQMVDRKLRYFSCYRRPILSYHVKELADGSRHLSVMAAII